MARSNRDRVGAALDSFVEGYRPFILQQMDARHGASKGEAKCQEFISQQTRPGAAVHTGPDQWDTGNVITILLSEWQYLLRLKLGKAVRGMFNEIEVIRNNWAHQQAFGTDDTLRALDTIKRLLGAIGAADQVKEVEKLHGEVMRTRITEMQRVATDRARRQPTEGTPLQGLKPWREIITPHRDVCNGTFAQAEFAADLAQVHRGEALPEYGDAKGFFRRTYASSFDSDNARYVGLQAGRIGIVTDAPNSVIVKPAVAQKQLAAERPAAPGQPAAPAAAGGDSTAPPPPAEESRSGTNPPVPQGPPLPKRFFGTVTVDAQRINRDVAMLAAEIIRHLAKLPNAEVKITVEIQADAPAGVLDDVVRTVNENCRTLKFINHGFEKE